MSSRLILDYIIINLFSGTTKQRMNSEKKDIFLKIKNDKNYLYQVSLKDYSWKNRFANTKNTLHTHNFIERRRLQKYIGGLLSIIIDEAGLEKRTNKLINYISTFNNEHIIKCYSKK